MDCRVFTRGAGAQTEVEQNHIVAAIVFELSKVGLDVVRNRVMAQLRNIDEDLACRVADGLGLDLPKAAKPAKAPLDLPLSDALSILKHEPPIAGRQLGILVADGSDGAVVEALQKAAKDKGASVKIVAPKVGGVSLKGGKQLKADEKIDGAPSVLFDAVALVLSEEGAAQLAGEKAALDFVSDAFAHCKAIGHSEGAAALMDKAGVEADDFVVPLGKDGTGTLVQKLASRRWERSAPRCGAAPGADHESRHARGAGRIRHPAHRSVEPGVERRRVHRIRAGARSREVGLPG